MERLTDSNAEIPSLLVENQEYWLQVYFKLKEYEDLEEQGLIYKQPFKVNDKVWIIIENTIVEYTVESIRIGKEDDTIFFVDGSFFTVWDKEYDKLKKWVFKTKEEAETELRRRKGR